MITIGLTGGIGTGKSSVAGILQELGAAIVDADKLGHEAYVPNTDGWRAVVEAFGRDILTPNNEIDRRKLGGIVFSDPAHLAKLNSIMHPRIKAMAVERFKQLAAQGTKVAVLEAAVLVEAKWTDIVDELWVTTADEDVCVRRVRARNNLPEGAVRARIRSQIPAAERLKYAQAAVANNGDLNELRRTVEQVWNKRILSRIGGHVHSQSH
ncbi:MAG: dephospho-CoA kinase [SAR202 cluster bacterium]|nr:dephospho-CoA kinase [SAR202 cluster bacterium]